jgi:hypothetical protein
MDTIWSAFLYSGFFSKRLEFSKVETSSVKVLDTGDKMLVETVQVFAILTYVTAGTTPKMPQVSERDKNMGYDVPFLACSNSGSAIVYVWYWC